MKEVTENKKIVVSCFFGILIGIFLLFSFQQINQAQAVPPIHNLDHQVNQKKSQFEDDLFESDPFERMRNFHKNFFKDSMFSESFDSGFPAFKDSIDSFATNKSYSILQKENENEVIYEIALENDVIGDSINVSVENGMVTVVGEKKIVRDDRDNQSYFSSSSSFSQSFSIPSGVDGDNVKIENEKKKIILKFPKIGTTA